LLLVITQLPFIFRMGFFDVDRQEVNTVQESLMDLFQLLDRAAKRWSRETTEDDGDGFATETVGQSRRRGAIEFPDDGLRGNISHA